MWQCVSCKSYNSDGLKECRCGCLRPYFAIPHVSSSGDYKGRPKRKCAQSEETKQKSKEGRIAGTTARDNESKCVKGQFYQSQFLRKGTGEDLG